PSQQVNALMSLSCWLILLVSNSRVTLLVGETRGHSRGFFCSPGLRLLVRVLRLLMWPQSSGKCIRARRDGQIPTRDPLGSGRRTRSCWERDHLISHGP